MKKHILTLLAFFFFLTCVTTVFASTINYYWIGTAHGGDGHTWTDVNNWSLTNGGLATTTYPDGSATSNLINANFTIGAGTSSIPVSVGTNILLNQLNLGVTSGGIAVTVYLTTGGSSNLLTIGKVLMNFHNCNLLCSNSNLSIANFTDIGDFECSSNSTVSINTFNITATYKSIIKNSTLTISNTLDVYGTLSVVASSTLQFTDYAFVVGPPPTFQAATGIIEASGTINIGSATVSLTYPGNNITNLGGNLKLTGNSSTHPVLAMSAVTFLQNSVGTLTADTATFNLYGDGVATDGAYIENDATFNSFASTFNLGVTAATDVDTYLNNTSTGVFTDNGSTFKLAGNNTALGSPSSIANDGTFFASAGSQILLTGANTSIANGDNVNDVATAYFVLGSSSAIILGTSGSSTDAVGSEVNNNATYGQFLLRSNANNSATIINYNYSLNNGVNGGMYYVQRYITGGSLSYRGYRLLTSPVNNGSGLIDFSYLNQTFTPGYTGAVAYNGIYTGGSGSGFSFSNANPLMYIYNETLNPMTPLYSYTTGKNVGITSISTTTLGTISTVNSTTSSGPGPTVTGTASLPPGNGFLLYYLGSNLTTSTAVVAPDNATVSNYGYINQGDVPVTLWYPPSASPGLSYTPGAYSAGFNMLGNPYPSTIDLNLVYNTNHTGANTYNTFYELDDVSKQYYSYIPSNGSAGGGGATSGGNASEYVASGQGFLVYVTAASQTLTFKESHKVYNKNLLTSSAAPYGLLVAKSDQLSGLNSSLASSAITRAIIQGPENELSGIHLKLKLDSTDYGETGIYFSKTGIDNYDHNDAVYLPGFGTKLSFSSFTADGVNVGINSMGNYIKGKRIKLDVEASTDGLFTISLSDISNIDPSIFNVYVIDNLKKDSIDLVQSQKISFNISVADPSTYGPNRFVLAVERKPLGAYQLVTLKGAKANGGVTVTWKTNNEGDFTGFGLQKLDPTTNTYSTVDSLQSNSSGSYTYDDPATITGVNTYRLEQNDIDGNVTYSKPIVVNYSLVASPGTLSVYPNPVKDAVILDFSGVTSANADSFNIEIYNSLGVLMIQKASSSNSVTEDVSTLKPGVYIVSVKTNSGNPVGNATFVKNQ